MPQLDSSIFYSQIFFFLIFSLIFYVVVVTNILPIISQILKIRKKKLKLVNAANSQEYTFKVNFNKKLSNFFTKIQSVFAQNFQLDDNKKINNQLYSLIINNIKLNQLTK